MTNDDPEALVSVYSTPNAFDAEIVKSMLADENIPSTVENATNPFAGLATLPCQVFVTKENEIYARRLIEEHEALHKKNVDEEFDKETSESESSTDED